MVALFVLMVLVPVAAVSTYMLKVAEPQYASTVAFSIRSESLQAPGDFLGGLGGSLGGLATGVSNDSELLNDFLGSQEIVEGMLGDLDLRAIFAQRGRDRVFALAPDASIEELRDHWRWRVKVIHDQASGVLNVTALAFDPRDARNINAAILAQSQALVDRLSQVARADITRYSEEELAQAEDRLRVARREFGEFRARNRIVDPVIEIENQGRTIGTLQGELLKETVAQSLLESSTDNPNDARVARGREKLAALEQQIEKERAAMVGAGDEGLVQMVGDFEALALEREFAEKLYVSAAAALDIARAEASRRSKYLAVHIAPTLAQTAEYPRRWMTIGIAAAALLLAWLSTVMIVYAVRDRR